MEKKHVVFLTILAAAVFITSLIGTTFAYFTATITGNESATRTEVTTATLGVAYSDGAQITANNLVPTEAVSGTYAPFATKDISVTNNSSVAINYSIAWTAVTNSFVSSRSAACTSYRTETDSAAKAGYLTQCNATHAGTDEFYYTITQTKDDGVSVASPVESAPVAMPIANGALMNGANAITDIALGANKDDAYTIKFYFVSLEDVAANGSDPAQSGNQDVNQGKTFTATLNTSVANVANTGA